MPTRRVALVCTVLNEESSIYLLLDSLAAQTRQPDEIIFVDGGSTDGTIGVIERFAARGRPVRLIRAPGTNIATGRNLAIKAATAKIIACTDAGVRLVPRWLADLVDPFERDGAGQPVDVVSGFFESDPRSVFELAMGATVLPGLREVDAREFLPSSRSIAFTKDAWARAGGYPEWLDYCEDVIFDLGLRRAGCRFAFVPSAVACFRPRSSLPAFFRQYYRYARGDGKAGLWPRRHLIRYSSYVFGTLVLLLGFWYKVAWVALLAAGVAYVYRPYRRLLPGLAGLNWRDRVYAMLLVPVIRLVGDMAKMVGYPVGVLWRSKKGRQGARS